MNKIIVLSAKSASGKDTIMKQLVAEEGFLHCVSHTTRPMREGEVEGREYYFVDQQDFIARKRNDEFVETRTYNTVQGQWFYGMSKDELNSKLEQGHIIMILDIVGLLALQDSIYKDRIISFYIDVDLKTRIQRSLDRETLTIQNLDECVRRAKADEEDFEEAYEICDYIIKPESSYCGKRMILDILALEGVR
mgnify:FL=1